MNTLSNYPQTLDAPDTVDPTWVEDRFCEFCGAEEIYGEIEETEYGFDVDYKCDNCGKYVTERDENEK